MRLIRTNELSSKLVLGVKFAAIHPNWNSANNTGDFCFGNDQQHNCLVRSAVCQGDSQHVEKFCQCPVAHTADYDKQECRMSND